MTLVNFTNLDFDQLAQEILLKKEDIIFLKSGYGGKGGDLGGENYELLKESKKFIVFDFYFLIWQSNNLFRLI